MVSLSTAGSPYLLFYLLEYLSCFPYPVFVHSRRSDAIDDDDADDDGHIL
jgi:hypothetical protein